MIWQVERWNCEKKRWDLYGVELSAASAEKTVRKFAAKGLASRAICPPGSDPDGWTEIRATSRSFMKLRYLTALQENEACGA